MYNVYNNRLYNYVFVTVHSIYIHTFYFFAQIHYGALSTRFFEYAKAYSKNLGSA